MANTDMKDSNGYPVSGTSPAALEVYEHALHQYLCFSLDPLATVDDALAKDPSLVMAHVLRAYLFLTSTEGAYLQEARNNLQAARALPHNEREQGHLKAIELWCAGHWRASCAVLEDVCVAWPHDVLALKVGQLFDFCSGDLRMVRDRLLRARPHWSPSMRDWHAVLGMLAFGLEETGRYAEAEACGREAVRLQPKDAWAQHAVAHVLETQGRREEGVAWMNANPAWRIDNGLAVHNWWHLALFHLGLGETAKVMELYDGPICHDDIQIQLELTDASALLWRLELAGVPLGNRWRDLAERWAHVADEAWWAFNDWHAVMAFVGAGREDLLRRKLQAQATTLVRGDHNGRAMAEVGTAVTQGFIAYGQQDWSRAVELLRAVRNRSQLLGGSHAQRDLIDLTLIAAARKGGQHRFADALEAERSTKSDPAAMSMAA